MPGAGTTQVGDTVLWPYVKGPALESENTRMKNSKDQQGEGALGSRNKNGYVGSTDCPKEPSKLALKKKEQDVFFGHLLS